ncbi:MULTISPECIES: heme ABC transporter permease/ATP-binding protein CydD [Rahnella]|jgi:ATP-binding cassette subfamily C protein CydD|uniref:ABC transporter, CydDC cysteine exporter (CydDC-E) family, permease/ATP-binding protein CydD n=1 Tax=Rahnella sp. (strain Y9602) TaxID=2703885 RepID=A0A0H3FAB9_RAHSY|nr:MULTISPECIES: cysteine/glutathione ABC transporter permease/ATP-binding protein CydD [Rahnella]AFE57641.1 cysteine/glutathione ABC transporter membrane/ATP-binding component [Rahnella aquatilis HX2]AYA06385.1 cysteine/glutathione ABC transporter permease/ATP-binding protein CydD [Rahnella aquatilis]ADW73070.1 ABC transporter, CydDC cysteine exporter (CydDC-E) family, permease/ATP-binding protein CydD [Rahnella aceris]AZP41620.1 cysteine/glutathione ABC transporter permease/ATP-binding protei
MNKTRQQELIRWLKQQSSRAKGWIRLSMMLGLLSGLLILAQAWLMAGLLHSLIIDHTPRDALLQSFLLMALTFVLRAVVTWLREQVGFICGRVIRQEMRKLVLDRLEKLGPAWIQGKPAGSWASIILEQIEDMQDYYSRYLPQIALAGIIPLLILVSIFPINWAAGLILLVTAPLIPLFMALVGMGAADANRRNFVALARLSGNFLDSLRGLDTLRLFHRGTAEIDQIKRSTENFRARTMDVLRLAFLSSAVLEFFASISIAVVAVYFGFSYLGELNFGSYGTPVTLFAGFLVLILAPEFFQPLRDLGAFYHAKAQAIGAAESLVTFLSAESADMGDGEQPWPAGQTVALAARDVIIQSPQGKTLAGPLTFSIQTGQRIAIVGLSGAGKSSLLNALLGFLPYQGSLTASGIELKSLRSDEWRKQLSWVGQNPYLPELTLRANILLNQPEVSDEQLQSAIERAYVNEFLPLLPLGLETELGDSAARLSIGQAQRVAVARALLSPCSLLLLDEPTASLDAHSEKRVMSALSEASKAQTSLLVTHQLEDTRDYDEIWVMEKGLIAERGTFAQLVTQNGLFASLLSRRNKEL